MKTPQRWAPTSKDLDRLLLDSISKPLFAGVLAHTSASLKACVLRVFESHDQTALAALPDLVASTSCAILDGCVASSAGTRRNIAQNADLRTATCASGAAWLVAWGDTFGVNLDPAMGAALINLVDRHRSLAAGEPSSGIGEDELKRWLIALDHAARGLLGPP